MSKTRVIGKYFDSIDLRNTDLKIKKILGLNIDKEFIPTIANTTNLDISNYKIIKKNQFAYSSMQTGRDETIRLALYKDDEPAVISPAYTVFEINNKNEILEDFLMMWFLRPESDRYGWFISDGTVRASLDWDRFCEIEIPNVNIDIQKKYTIILTLLNNKKKNLILKIDLLNKIKKSLLHKLFRENKKKALGPYIKEVNLINDGKFNKVRGISSVKKSFIKTKANMSGVSIEDYKIVEFKNFAYNPNTARMGDRIPIALNIDEPCLVSKIYPVFKVKDEKVLSPYFLKILLSRSEFDRYARYNSWGSARETFEYSEMLRVPVIIPKLESQEILIKIEDILEKFSNEYEKIENLVPKISPILIKGASKHIQ